MVDEGHRLRGHHVVFRDGEQRGLLEGQTPLNGAQDEQLGPRLLQKGDLTAKMTLIIFEFSGQNCIIPGPERVG